MKCSISAAVVVQPTLTRMVEAGLDVARLNFSHGDREIHAENAERIRAASARVGRQVAILQDLPGPKIRIGVVRDGHVELKPGEHTLVSRAIDSDGHVQPAADDPSIKNKKTYWEANAQYPRRIRLT